MKKLDLNNVVIEILDVEHGKKVKEFFSKYTDEASYFEFTENLKDKNTFRFYGFIQNIFDNCSPCKMPDGAARARLSRST